MKNSEQFNSEISKKLSILAPTEFVSSNSILNFERYRELRLDWYRIFEKKNDFFNPLNDFKNYINNLWGGDELAKEVFYKNKLYWTIENVCYFNSKQECLYAKNVYCIVHKTSGKLFIFLDNKNLPIDDSKIASDGEISTAKDFKGYNYFWSKIEELAISFLIAFKADENDILGDETKVGTKEVEDKIKILSEKLPKSVPIQRDFLYYSEEYARLAAQLEFYISIEEKIKSEKENFINGIIGKDNIETEIEEKALNYSNLRTKSYEIREKIRRLSQKLKNIGYYLADEIDNGTVIKLPDGKTTITLEKGSIYKQYKDIYRWNTEESYQVETGVARNIFNQVTSRYYETRIRLIPHEAIVDLYEKVSFNIDPVFTYQNNLAKDGKFIINAVLKKQGFFTQDNIPLSKILEKCDNDEYYRQKCVIVIPEYDFIQSDRIYKKGAVFYHNPLPGIISKRFPTMGFMEQLAYKISWLGSELGQIVGSINLAPGETREINESSKFSIITNQSLSSKSIYESNISDSSDFASEFQNEASKEMTKNESLSASVSGSYGGFVSGSASGSLNTSLKTFTRDMSKIAKKVSNTINRKVNQESSISTVSTTTTENNDSKKVTITNINQGSTLNLFLYQINNRFRSGLFVNDLEFHMTASKELIQGSELYEHYSYKLQDFEFFFSDLYSKLPFSLNEEEQKIFAKRIILLLNDSFGEYEISSGSDSTNNTILRFDTNDSDKKVDKALDAEQLYEIFIEKLKSKIIDDSLNILADILTMPTKALYLDSKVGINPATEPYAEKMRLLESLRVESDIEKNNVINKNLKLKNSIITGGNIFIVDINTVIKPDKNNKTQNSTSIIELSKSVDTALKYEVYIDSIRNTNATIECIKDGKAFLINWNYQLTDENLKDIIITSEDNTILITQ